MKKLFYVNFMLVLAFLLLLNLKTYAIEYEDNENFEYSDIEKVLQTSTSVSKVPDTLSKHIIAIDRNSKRILYEKDAFSQTPMASTTKILTAIIAIEHCKLEDQVYISENAAKVKGSILGINKNSTMSMEDLLYGLMLRSGNDCAIAIAEYIGGSIDQFSSIMNDKAKELELKNSNFTSPHGLDDENHYTTAYELAIITDYALKNETFKRIVGTKEAVININNIPKTISNTNELLGNYEGVYGVKTGFTFNSGRCLVTACKKNNLDIIVVVLGADSKKIRTIDSVKILNYIFSNYTNIDISNIVQEEFDRFQNYFYRNIIIEKSDIKPIIELGTIENSIFPLQENELNCISSELYSLYKLKAPLYSKTKIGEITIKINNEIITSYNIILKNNLTRKTWKTYYKEIFKSLFSFYV